MFIFLTDLSLYITCVYITYELYGTQYGEQLGLTASGCARPRCHVMAICTQDWLTSGSVAIIISMVTASLSVGGGCLMVQGVLGTQAHQSN